MKKDTLTKLTSVKILKSLYEDFKFRTVNSSMNLQKLVNRSIHQYIHDNAIRERVESYDQLHISGSQF
tara:strand:- start:418 stop:621 length:204 start_codon:yes stop_codon:yes gene_type:complete